VQIAVSNRGQRVMVMDTKGSLRLPVRLRTGQYELDLLSDHAMRFSPDGQRVITVDKSGVINQWDVAKERDSSLRGTQLPDSDTRLVA
jgi:hypothetical protein